jgi:hypothetical protein
MVNIVSTQKRWRQRLLKWKHRYLVFNIMLKTQ